MNPFDEGRGEGEGLLVLISGAYPHAECGDLQYALDGEHPREAHVHVLQRVLVRVALPMELQCMTLTNTRAERDGQKRAFVKQAYQFPACNSRFPPSPLFSASALRARRGKESENRGEAVRRENRPSSTRFCNVIFRFFRMIDSVQYINRVISKS